jgi:hypothetical protein
VDSVDIRVVRVVGYILVLVSECPESFFQIWLYLYWVGYQSRVQLEIQVRRYFGCNTVIICPDHQGGRVSGETRKFLQSGRVKQVRSVEHDGRVEGSTTIGQLLSPPFEVQSQK